MSKPIKPEDAFEFRHEFMGEWVRHPPPTLNFRDWRDAPFDSLHVMRHERACEVCPMHLVCRSGGRLADRGYQNLNAATVVACEECYSVLFLDIDKYALYICELIRFGHNQRQPISRDWPRQSAPNSLKQQADFNVRLAVCPDNLHPGGYHLFKAQRCNQTPHPCCAHYYIFNLLVEPRSRCQVFIPEHRNKNFPQRYPRHHYAQMRIEAEEFRMHGHMKGGLDKLRHEE